MEADLGLEAAHFAGETGEAMIGTRFESHPDSDGIEFFRYPHLDDWFGVYRGANAPALYNEHLIEYYNPRFLHQGPFNCVIEGSAEAWREVKRVLDGERTLIWCGRVAASVAYPGPDGGFFLWSTRNHKWPVLISFRLGQELRRQIEEVLE